jgi:hypothetical protein
LATHLLEAVLSRVLPGPLIGLAGGAAATGGVGVVVLALIALWRLRRAKRRPRGDAALATAASAAGGAALLAAPFPRALDEARQLLGLRQTEGRVAVLDALRGMFLDDELHKLSATASPADAAVATRLRTAIDARVQEVAPLSVHLEE